MRLVVALVALFLVGFAPASAGAQTPPPQTLSITLHGDGARATQLPSYDPAVPIAVAVADDQRQRIDELSIVAAGPAGTTITVPLARSAQGGFAGTLTLGDQGTWRLRLISRSGPLSTGTTPVTLDVAAPPPSNAGWIGWAVGVGMFIVVGGGGFFILRRMVGAPAPAQPSDPADRTTRPTAAA